MADSRGLLSSRPTVIAVCCQYVSLELVAAIASIRACCAGSAASVAAAKNWSLVSASRAVRVAGSSVPGLQPMRARRSTRAGARAMISRATIAPSEKPQSEKTGGALARIRSAIPPVVVAPVSGRMSAASLSDARTFENILSSQSVPVSMSRGAAAPQFSDWRWAGLSSIGTILTPWGQELCGHSPNR